MHPTLSAPLVFILQVILFHPTSCTTPSPELELCIRLETYMDNVEVLVEEPVKMKRYQWCVGVPPRCTTFTTELKNRTKIEAVEKNRTVVECCPGFVEINSDCVPECPSNHPCPNMKCQDTKHCFCLAGYTGLYCNTTCPVGRWGSNCTSKCQCGDVNGNKCHHLTGKCILLTPATVLTTQTMPTLPTALTTLMPPVTIPTVTPSTQQLTTPIVPTFATPITTTATTIQSTTTTTTTTTKKSQSDWTFLSFFYGLSPFCLLFLSFLFSFYLFSVLHKYVYVALSNGRRVSSQRIFSRVYNCNSCTPWKSNYMQVYNVYIHEIVFTFGVGTDTIPTPSTLGQNLSLHDL
uniref:Cell death abnormality protein 1 n=1 Tax=Cacopsylla melanoneura TaxID=428564 RepID=A0A8D8V572_9HEMI